MCSVIDLSPVFVRRTITVDESASEEFVEYINPRESSRRKCHSILISAKSIEKVPALIEQGKALIALKNGKKYSEGRRKA